MKFIVRNDEGVVWFRAFVEFDGVRHETHWRQTPNAVFEDLARVMALAALTVKTRLGVTSITLEEK